MILEGLVTTINEDGSTNVSPMGPQVDEDLEFFVLKPFDTSTTFKNLKRSRMGVLHVTDDVGTIARAATGKLKSQSPATTPASTVKGQILINACRAYEFEVQHIDESMPRIHLNCRTVHVHRLRDFWGFNRAKHAVIEAAILATRLDFLPAEEVSDSFLKLETVVHKTGGESEKESFELLKSYVTLSNSSPTGDTMAGEN